MMQLPSHYRPWSAVERGVLTHQVSRLQKLLVRVLASRQRALEQTDYEHERAEHNLEMAQQLLTQIDNQAKTIISLRGALSGYPELRDEYVRLLAENKQLVEQVDSLTDESVKLLAQIDWYQRGQPQ